MPKRERPLQCNPGPLEVTKATHQCVKCRQYAPRCICWDGPDYRPLNIKPEKGES